MGMQRCCARNLNRKGVKMRQQTPTQSARMIAMLSLLMLKVPLHWRSRHYPNIFRLYPNKPRTMPPLSPSPSSLRLPAYRSASNLNTCA